MNEADTPSKSYHHGNLRAELLDTAIAQLREVGSDDLSLRALARAIGVSQTAPYRHFADKSELLAAMATRGYRNLLKALRQAGELSNDGPQEQLKAFAHAYVDYAASNPQLFKLMFGPAVQPTQQYPELRHASRDTSILKNRARVYEEARKKNPNRWSGKTRNWTSTETVVLNGNLQQAIGAAA